jgi:hypothetical protein
VLAERVELARQQDTGPLLVECDRVSKLRNLIRALQAKNGGDT